MLTICGREVNFGKHIRLVKVIPYHRPIKPVTGCVRRKQKVRTITWTEMEIWRYARQHKLSCSLDVPFSTA